MRRNRWKGFLGLLVMVLSLAGMYLWQTYGREAADKKEVLLARLDIEPGTLIDPSLHFVIKRVDSELIIPNALTPSEVQGVKGLAAKYLIPQNAIVSGKFFEASGLVLSDERFIMKIPESWVYAVPTSLRRGDEIFFYAVSAKLDPLADSRVQTEPSGLPVYGQQLPGAMEGSELVLSSYVAYVKDGANREVVDMDERKRMDGSSQVSSIEIVCTDEEKEKLVKSVSQGNKFILVYR